ncbi:hypothetical protein [Halogeometricum limi]|uniref:Uncharacterized protein n=1 Tax=Halogeometricum limi TaxID=555875 RepID=A0A1I6I4L9_9EURY|nr:hypothetical protein [Halogeometricum limi]SFR61651.1 hypothetical protein SAMN04488124_2812 [Halogeometricum limi]
MADWLMCLLIWDGQFHDARALDDWAVPETTDDVTAPSRSADPD